MPLPLSVHEPKGGQHTAGKESLPWWAVPAQTPDVMASSNERDMTAFPAPNPGEQDDTGGLYGPRVEFKRVKADEYAVRSGGVWRRVRPQIGVLLRNQVPTTRRDAAQSRHERRTESGLFSEEILSENQCFAADLYFADQPLANEFLKAAAPLLGGDPAVCSWLRIGRGGRPVVIAQSASVPFAEDEEGPADHLTLTLTSDLIARTPWLTFLTELTLADLARLVKEAGGDPLSTAGLSLSRERTFSETSEVYGFNAATGLPRAAAVAIRRGSVFRIERLASSTTILQPWRTALRQAARNGGLGERTAEGFGRFVLDLELHEPFYWKSAKAGEGLAPPIRAADWREEVLVRVNRLLKAFEDTRGQQLNDRSGRHWPSVTQWQWLRSQARVARTDADLAKVLADLRDHAKQLSGAGWGKLPQQLEGTVQEAGQVAMPS